MEQGEKVNVKKKGRERERGALEEGDIYNWNRHFERAHFFICVSKNLFDKAHGTTYMKILFMVYYFTT